MTTLDDVLLTRIAPGSEQRVLSAGECLIVQGDEANSLFVVVTGKLGVF
jgi:CRP-like cAMP-binding protein